LINRIDDRIGLPYLRVDLDKVVAIVGRVHVQYLWNISRLVWCLCEWVLIAYCHVTADPSESKSPDNGNALAPPDECSQKIASNIMEFFSHEVRLSNRATSYTMCFGAHTTRPPHPNGAVNYHVYPDLQVARGRLPNTLLPLQSGVGNIANAVVSGFIDSPYRGLNVWTEVLQDTMLDFFDSGKLDYVSTASLCLSKVCD